MALYIAEHSHAAETCPAKNPEIAPMLLQLVSDSSARAHGLRIHADAVANGAHHLVLIMDGPNEKAVRDYLAPFGQVGSLTVTPASHCETVVARGSC
jgi:hypothetical protein